MQYTTVAMAASHRVMLFFLVIALSVSTMVVGHHLAAAAERIRRELRKDSNPESDVEIDERREHLKYRVDLLRTQQYWLINCN